MNRENVFIYAADPCWKRLLDANKIKNYLLKNDYKILNKPGKADTILIVTCGFLKSITDSTLRIIKKYQKYNAEIIVAGCLPDTDKEELSKIFNGETLTTKELTEKIEAVFPPKRNFRFKETQDANILFKNFNQDDNLNYLQKKFLKMTALKTIIKKIKQYLLRQLIERNSLDYFYTQKQFHIRIAWGCIGNCSYCVIKKATEKFHSKPLAECIKEFEKGLDEGCKNFVLDASDVGLYGIDINSSFSELLDKLTIKNGDYKISVREVHPRWIVKYTKELERIFKRNKILIFDLSIQSMNGRILKLMKRYSNVKEIKNAFSCLRKAVKDVFFTCQFIIGFPTETWEEFEETLSSITDMGFNGGQIYLFSCKKGTEAENIEPKIDEKEMMKRLEYSKKKLENSGFYVQYIYRGKPLGLNFIMKK
jgi:tRNA A37 methylthiotransferase MiaB